MPAPVNLELQRSGRIFGHLLVLNNLISLPALKMTAVILSKAREDSFLLLERFGWEMKLRRVGYTEI